MKKQEETRALLRNTHQPVDMPSFCRCRSSGSSRAGQILLSSSSFALQVQEPIVLPGLKRFAENKAGFS